MSSEHTTRRDRTTEPARDGADDAGRDHGEHGAQGGHGAQGRHGAAGGHDAGGSHAGHDPEVFRRRFWLTLALTVPIVLTSPTIMDWFGFTLDVPGVGLVGPVLGTIVFVYGGQPFLRGAVDEARSRQPGMMLLIALGITVAFVASMATSLGLFDLEFWWELATLVTIMLLGHWQEMKAIGRARGALSALAELIPDDAERVTDDGTETVSVTDLDRGDVVLVRPGSRVPADGTVVEGAAEVDESMITGESTPVPRSEGDRVVAGTVAADSALRVEVTAVGDETALAGIQRLVTSAQSSRGRTQALADRVAGLLFYVAAGSALLTFVVWTLVATPDQAVVRSVTVLVIACPHALGLAIPLVVSLSTALAAEHGILVKDRVALERMRQVDTVLFDKTGTLTTGEHKVTGVEPAEGRAGDDVLRIAAAVESDSEHPLARAIVAAGREQGEVPTAEGFSSLTGRGVTAVVDGIRYAVGGPALLRDVEVDVPEDLRDRARPWERRGAAVLHVVQQDEPPSVVGLLALEDTVRPEARDLVDDLRGEGVTRIAMITGDSTAVAEAVADELGFVEGTDEVVAEVLPEDKDSAVARLQGQGSVVAMVGDGVNDAPALARADVGLAIGAGTDVAIESAGVVLASSDPRGVTAVIRLSHAVYRRMRQNLAWAAGYNVVAIPLAAGVLAPWGVSLSPAVGAVMMSASTVIVALNAQLLRRVPLGPG